MQIVIPMSGFGERFRRAGYQVPKPLIEVDGRPIIGHVIDLFPGEKDFIFICNEDHLSNPEYRMEEILKALCPTGRIIAIPAHRLGPVYAVRQIEHLLDPTKPIIVNYCDFTCYWNWADFKSFVEKNGCVGAIPSYRGFHPHSLGATNYAYIKIKEGTVLGGDGIEKIGAWVEDIQEKQPFTDNRMEEYASSGTYYFSSAKILSDAFKKIIEQNIHVNGEFYVSLAYKPLLKEGAPIVIYPLQHFMQWGTPEDLMEYNFWSNSFRRLLVNEKSESASGALVVPMAGLGKRFLDYGYTLSKPLIPVSGKPMAIQAIAGLPNSLHQSLVLRADMPGLGGIKESIKKYFPSALIAVVPEATEGQACTALIGLEALEQSEDSDLSPVTFGVCDSIALFNQATFKKLIDDPEVDVIVWGARGHSNALRNPQMFGWIDVDNGRIKTISAKSPLGSPATDPIVIGTFTFKNQINAKLSIDALIKRNGRINNEFYLDSCINDAIALGLRCYYFEVDSFISWGTPDDLKTFEYWQSCFHKWPSHPYRIELDSKIEKNGISALIDLCSSTSGES